MSSVLSIKIVGDASSAKTALSDTGNAVEQAESKTSKLGETMKGALVVAAAAAAKAAVDFGSECVTAAIGAEKAQSSLRLAYGDAAQSIIDLSATAAERMGLDDATYDQFATSIGGKLMGIGLSADEAASQTDALTQRAADLAAQYGGDTSAAITALQGAITGQTKGMKTYGVTISDATVMAELQAEGLDTLTGKDLDNAKAQARLKIAMDDTTSASGAFAAQADTTAGKQAIANAKWETAKGTLGEALLPIVNKVTDALGWLADEANKHPAIFQAIIVVLGVLAGGFAVAQIASTLFGTAATAAMGPIGLAIMAVVAVIALIATHWDQVKEVAGRVFDWLTGAVGWVKDVVTNAFTSIRDWVVGVWDAIWSKVTGIVDKIKGVFNTVKGWFGFSAMLDADYAFASSRTTYAARPIRFGFLDDLDTVTNSIRSVPGIQKETNNYDIHIDGIITDPVRTAREIEKVIRQGKNMSSGTIRVGV